jgi:RsiW-degrading membrane proteinase PrsW (M82 family)
MKPLTLILTGLIVFAVLVGIFYAISRQVLAIPIVRDNPSVSLVIWTVIIGVPLVLTAQIMRMVFDMGKRRKR